jgi:peptidoglycan/xylan/chitin deacetylase (PgdA/CDA1 family)
MPDPLPRPEPARGPVERPGRTASTGARPNPPPRLSVALTFDHDAISAEVNRGDGPVDISRGEFGPRVGVPRILALLDRHAIPATFFVPGHTAVTFPGSVSSIVAGGHELGCHGWAHEDLASLEPLAERDVMARSYDTIGRAARGVMPKGFRAPYWSLSPHTLDIATELGFRYDSSLMADDVRLSWVRVGDRHDVAKSELGTPGPLVEVPISWSLDDFPHFEPGRRGTGPMSAASKVEQIWTDELRYAWAHEPGAVLTVTMHPEVIGRGHRMLMLERFIAAARELDGVVFERLDTIVARWAAANARSESASTATG